MLKQYVIIPKKPKMSAGKIASQVAHATLMGLEAHKRYSILEYWLLKRKWIRTGMCVIVLECADSNVLHSIARYHENNNQEYGLKLPFHLYVDEGMTEVDAMTPTAFATGIITEDKQWIFEKFKLYSDKKIKKKAKR